MPANQNLFAALRGAFPADLDATAVETCDTAVPLYYRWRDLDRASARIANLLESLALPAGARIAVQADKSVEALLLYLAVLRAGLVYLPLNTAYQAGELAYFIADAEPGVVVCSGRNFAWVSQLAFQAGVQNVFTLNDDRSGSLLERAAWHSDEQVPAARRAGDLAAIVYTSGTTGRSKGAMLTHGNLAANARDLHAAWHFAADDVLLHMLPLFHVHGLFVACHTTLLNGSAMFLEPRFDARRGASGQSRFDPDRVLQLDRQTPVGREVTGLLGRLGHEAGSEDHLLDLVAGEDDGIMALHESDDPEPGGRVADADDADLLLGLQRLAEDAGSVLEGLHDRTRFAYRSRRTCSRRSRSSRGSASRLAFARALYFAP